MSDRWLEEAKARVEAVDGGGDTACQAWGMAAQSFDETPRSVSLGDDEVVLTGGVKKFELADFIAGAFYDLPRALAIVEAGDRLAALLEEWRDVEQRIAERGSAPYCHYSDCAETGHAPECMARRAAEALAAYRKAREG